MTETTQQHLGAGQFQGHFDALAGRLAGAAEWERELREGAFGRFAELGWPGPREEEWRHTPLDTLKKAEFCAEATAPDASDDKQAIEEYGAGELGGARAVFVNGRFIAELSTLDGLPEGVVVGSLAQTLAGDGAALEPYLGRIAKWNDHAFAALNTALFGDGLYLSVPADVEIEKPIHALYLTGAGEPAALHPRNLIMLGANARACLIESYAGVDESVYFTNAVTEVEMGEGSYLDHYKIQRESRAAFHFQTLAVHQRRDSKFDTHALTEGGRLGRNDIDSVIDGEGCDTIFNGLYMLTGDQLLDTHTLLDHARPHCHSREIYKGILAGKSRAVFRGKILVRQHAQKTDAVQSSKNLLLSGDAQVNAQPQLEIYADDVKCTHGATIGQLDADALFYAASRGLDPRLARAMLTFAFANDNLYEVGHAGVRDHLEGLIHRWLEQHGAPEATS